MDLMSILIQAVSGVAGAHATGATMKKNSKPSMGATGNSVVGLIGGLVGGLLMTYLSKGGIDLSSITGALANSGGVDATGAVQDIAGGGLGGALATIIAGLMKNQSAGKNS